MRYTLLNRTRGTASTGPGLRGQKYKYHGSRRVTTTSHSTVVPSASTSVSGRLTTLMLSQVRGSACAASARTARSASGMSASRATPRSDRKSSNSAGTVKARRGHGKRGHHRIPFWLLSTWSRWQNHWKIVERHLLRVDSSSSSMRAGGGSTNSRSGPPVGRFEPVPVVDALEGPRRVGIGARGAA